jgi:hypothetical protein
LFNSLPSGGIPKTKEVQMIVQEAPCPLCERIKNRIETYSAGAQALPADSGLRYELLALVDLLKDLLKPEEV